MPKSPYTLQAEQYAALAAKAKTPEERADWLAMEKFMRECADANHRIDQVRARNLALFAGRDRPANDPDPLPAAWGA